MEKKEIYEILAEATLKSVINITDWIKVKLYIERQEKSVGFESAYINVHDEEILVDTEADYFASKAVKELYHFTNQSLEHKDWNKAVCTVTIDGELSIEYIWDQEWQDEIDSYDRKLS